MKQILLYIDTSDSSKTTVGLTIDGKKQPLEGKKEKASQNLLPLIDNILKSNKLSLTEVTGIEVNVGPGSYTGLRVGIAVANTLGYLLEVPVNGQKLVTPKYS